ALLGAAGFLRFSADAGPLLANGIMQAKPWFIALGVVNAVLFRALWNERLAQWDIAPPILGRAQALASIAIWGTAGVLGQSSDYSVHIPAGVRRLTRLSFGHLLIRYFVACARNPPLSNSIPRT